MPRNLNSRGIAHPAILIFLAVVGILLFLFITSSASFKNNLFSYLFPKPKSQAATTNPWVSAYYLGYFWDWISDPTQAVNAVDMSTMTHLIFARYAPGSGSMGGSAGQLMNGAGTGHTAVEDPLIAKAHSNNVKAILMIGGVGDGGGFVASTANPTIRATFISNILNKAVAKNYDGVDIDWEDSLDNTTQQNQLIAFLTELRTAANSRPRYQTPNQPFIITFPGFWANSNFDTVQPAWKVTVANLVDQYNLMSYDMMWCCDGWQTWFWAALKGEAPTHPTSLEHSIQTYVNAGVPRSKLGIGIGLYGGGWRAPVNGPRQDPGTAQDWGGDDTNDTYAEFYKTGMFDPASFYWDSAAQVGYYSYNPPKSYHGNTVSYLTTEDDRTIASQGAWVRAGNAAGTIVWGINYGDVTPTSNPAMQAIKQAFLNPNATPIPTPTTGPTPPPLPSPTPTPTPTPLPSGIINIGETNILTIPDNGNANLLIAQQTTLAQTATIQSLSFYVTNAAGNLRLGIYDATGPGGGPGAKKAESNSFTPIVGWNTANVISPALLPAGTYWLAYLPSDGNLTFVKDYPGAAAYYSYNFGVMPTTFSTAPNTEGVHWSLYATFNSATVPTLPGDLNGDNKVDIIDLSVLLSHWLGTDAGSDISKDGKVNIVDLSILLSNWLK
ncbi:hypothetical protein HYW46_04980 [Candidatus Daviesbacteria bacterium]|nr:hypothetical protein [Candidatus Daviesbacteria bacterium]